jgi:hypothetical protein
MTEAEWLGCEDPQKMLEFVQESGKASGRKLRLFACACCRAVWHLLPDQRSRKAVEVSERYADGLVPAEKLKAVWGDMRWAANVAHRKDDDAAGVRWLVAHLTEEDALRTLSAAWSAWYLGGREVQQPLQCALLRDLLGPLPFRDVRVPASVLSWNDGCVVKLASAIYDRREYTLERMGVLADALEDAGCADPGLLGHLRGLGPHLRGCWAVDLLLGKE